MNLIINGKPSQTSTQCKLKAPWRAYHQPRAGYNYFVHAGLYTATTQFYGILSCFDIHALVQNSSGSRCQLLRTPLMIKFL